jgi:hypothetical protein
MQNLIFSTTSKEIKKLNFLKADPDLDSSFTGTDTKELYDENLKIQPDDWYYRNNAVRYTINSMGYRCPEFKKINWQDSIVVFGCSVVFGTGVDDQHTIPAMIEQKSGIPTINMGVGGSSMMYAFHNSLILSQKFPTPKAVVHLWTDYSRTVYYRKRYIEHYGQWNIEDNNYIDHWNKDDEHAKSHAVFNQMASKQLWCEKTKYYEASVFTATQKLLDCNKIKNGIDKARDLMHTGIKTNDLAADQILNNLNL